MTRTTSFYLRITLVKWPADRPKIIRKCSIYLDLHSARLVAEDRNLEPQRILDNLSVS